MGISNVELDKTPSNVMKIIDIFTYKGHKVVIQKIWNCHQYLLIHHGEIYCNYLEYGKVKYQPTEQEQKQIIDNLRTSACETIDYHNQGKVVNKIKAFFKHEKKTRAGAED